MVPPMVIQRGKWRAREIEREKWRERERESEREIKRIIE